MMQRGEVEDFFLMAMESTRKEVENTEMKGNNGTSMMNDKHYGEKVDIQELLPKDKQRIITNLYTKLALGPK